MSFFSDYKWILIGLGLLAVAALAIAGYLFWYKPRQEAEALLQQQQQQLVVVEPPPPAAPPVQRSLFPVGTSLVPRPRMQEHPRPEPGGGQPREHGRISAADAMRRRGDDDGLDDQLQRGPPAAAGGNKEAEEGEFDLAFEGDGMTEATEYPMDDVRRT